MKIKLKGLTALLCCLALSVVVKAQTISISTNPATGSCNNTQVDFTGNASSTTTATSFTFNGGNLPAGWVSSPYVVSSTTCNGKNSPDNSPYFWATQLDSNGKRFVQTNSIDVSLGGNIEFYIRYGNNEGSGCEQPDAPNEEVYLQYSVNNGATWVTIYDQWDTTRQGNYPWYNWHFNSISIPAAAQTTQTLFRWYQPGNSGVNFDNWGLEDISISAVRPVSVRQWDWDFGDGTTAQGQTQTHNYSGSGTYNVILDVTFSDNSTKSTNINYEVYVDNTAPTPNSSNLPNITAQCQVEIGDVPVPNATDDCGGAVTVSHDANFPITAQGTTVITWTYTDAQGNSSQQTQNVVINDDQAPVADVATLADITAQCEVKASDVAVPSATDNCGGTVSVSHDANFPITAQGTKVITWTYTDAQGNSSQQTQNVVINDDQAPVADVATLADITAQCEVKASDVAVPSATDNCGGTVSVSHDANFPITAQGTTVITWTYTDAQGNSSQQTQNVIINDDQAPVADVATLADITAQCEVKASDVAVPSATDNCGGTVSVSHDANFPITAQGTTVITWTYTDAQGNSSQQTQNVVINDDQAPVADVATLTDITAQCEVKASDVAVPSATDNCGGTVSVSHDANFPITAQGTTVITWTYTDAQGNSSQQTQNVVINDDQAPVADVATLADITAQCEVKASDVAVPSATDNCGGTVSVSHDANFPITAQGTTVITWTYTDAQGNSSQQTQNVVILDDQAPVADVATLADITDQCEVKASDVAVPSATDNCGGTVSVSHDANFPITAQGTTVITWTYTDAQGNSSQQTQNVVINDDQAPVADVATLTDITAQCEVKASDVAVPSATDNCGGTVSVSHDANFPITAQGTTVITWTYTDAQGNSSQQTQNVIINDDQAPVADVATLADITAQCEVKASDVAVPSATDNCGGTVSVSHDANFPITAQGTTVITWTYTDAQGNSSQQTQNVVINDDQAPVADVATLADITAQCEVKASDVAVPSATDNCGGTVSVSHDANFPITAQGTTVITWTYTDAQGNSSQQTQNVMVQSSPIEQVTLDDLQVIYNGQEHNLVVNNLPTGASVSYAISPSGVSVNGAIDAGTYQVTAVITPSAQSPNCPSITLDATLQIDRAPQQIIFDDLDTLYIEDDADFQLQATASSGLPVSYTYNYTTNSPAATVSTSGWVTLLTSGLINITAHQDGNTNYQPAAKVNQELQIMSRDSKMYGIQIEDVYQSNPADVVKYEIPCGQELGTVNITIEAETNALVSPSRSFTIDVPKPGIYTQEVIIESQDGSTEQTYEIIIEKKFDFFAIVEQKFDNVLLVNNNASNNGGYTFISYEWYADGVLIGTDPYYSAGDKSTELLNPETEYSVNMTTTEGEIIRTCLGKVSLVHDFETQLIPNPTALGTPVSVRVGFGVSQELPMDIRIYDLHGHQVHHEQSFSPIAALNLPQDLASGLYLVVCRTAKNSSNTKLIIE